MRRGGISKTPEASDGEDRYANDEQDPEEGCEALEAHCSEEEQDHQRDQQQLEHDFLSKIQDPRRGPDAQGRGCAN